MVDAADLKSVDRKVVGVRVPPWAPYLFLFYKKTFDFDISLFLLLDDA